MNRLLQRQIERSFDKDFDITTLPANVQKLLAHVDSSYEDFESERKLLENTLEVNSSELTLANSIIKEKNLQTSSILEQCKEALDESLIISKTDTRGNITYVNDNFCEVSGYSHAELLGKPHSIIRHPDMSTKLFSKLWNRILNKEKWSGVLTNRAKDGSSYYLNANIVPLFDMSNNITEFITLSEDITHTIKLQEESEHLHKRTKLIMDTQESMIVISDSVHGVVDANQKFFTISGFKDMENFKSKHECICELFLEKENYLVPSTPERYWVEPIFEKPNDLHRALILDTQGNEIIFDVRASKIELDNSHYILSTFSDITDIENMREKAESAEKSKSEFLANMSHEIRTPMNGISGFLQLLEKTELTLQQKKYLSITQSSVKILLKIINDILDFSKIESGCMVSETIELNPFVEFEKAFLAFTPNAHAKNISFQIDLDSKLYENLLIDELHIRQVMQNLINNAIKFTPKQGTIIASVRVLNSQNNSQYIRFGVRDNGIGIAKENHAKVLQAFSQADNSTTRNFGGTGLGLSISSSLVELMGGTLKLESRLNEGSFFYFDLAIKKVPLQEGISQKLENGKNTTLCNNLLSKNLIIHEDNENTDIVISLNILIAEDYEINRILIEELLKTYQKITYKFVENGQEAIDEFHENSSYDLIFMDINMPVLDGVQATKILREESDIPIVALTANALDGDRERFLSLGMNDYLAKPIVISELQRVLLYYARRGKKVEKSKGIEKTTLRSVKDAISQTVKNTKFPEGIVLRLFKSYISSSDKLMQRLLEGVTTNDFDMMASAAHDLKSSSKTLCFTQVGEIAGEVEAKALKETGFEYEEFAEILKTHFDDLKVCLSQLEK